MSFKNPNRDLLREDLAREHFENHVLLHDAMHVAQRRDDAYRKWCERSTKEPSFSQIEEARRDLEEEQFAAWYDLKKKKGFAQFGDPFACAEDYE